MTRKIIIDANIPYIKGVLEPFFEVEYYAGQDINSEIVKDASVLMIRTRTKCDENLLKDSKVEFIGTTTIGFDHLDTNYCDNKGIKYATAAGCNARAVLQYVCSVLVHLSREQHFKPLQKVLGVIGVGNVGSLVAEFGRKMGFRVVCCDPPRMNADSSLGYVSQRELLKQADIVTMHVPLNNSGEYKTLSMADSDFFDSMRFGSIFINSSRGAVVCDEALCEGLRSGRIGTAVIDVWNGEPDINRELLALVRYATPHIAGYSLQGKANGTALIVRAIARQFNLPLLDWYPSDALIQVTDAKVSWEMICENIDSYYNVEEDDKLLREHVSDFEKIRDNYKYRREFF